jgi:RNA polymerase sigma-70 factor (ECF subfamily)
LDAHRAFRKERQRQIELEPFEHPAALVDFLTGKEGDLDQKDSIYAALVRTAQRLEEGSELASTLLWLGLWPALDATYNRLQWKYFRDDPEALVSELGARFTRIIHNANLDRISRVAATLRLNVQRDILDELKRQWADESRNTPLPSDDYDENEGPYRRGRDLKLARSRLQTRAESELGMPLHLDVDQDIHALRELIAKAVGDEADADLIIGMAVHEENQRELADRLGISHEAARKRVQRALKRLREALEKK